MQTHKGEFLAEQLDVSYKIDAELNAYAATEWYSARAPSHSSRLTCSLGTRE